MRVSSLVTPTSAAALVGLLATSVRAQGSLTEASQAAITDPTAECAYYNYVPVASQAGNFPPNWVQPAVMPANDTTALAKWNSIKAQIPTNIPVKGTVTGNFSDFTPTYSPSDPDCWWSYDKCTTPKLAGLKPDTISVPEPMTLGYGFDDGPNCSHNAFYDYLTSQNQKATMFYIGSNVQNHPLEAQRALADGHEICVHTWSHPYMTAVESESVFAELYYTMQMIKLATGVTPTCWRPPYGDIDDRVRAVGAALGLRAILWQYDSNDWQVGSVAGITPATVDANYEALIASAGNGTFATQGTIILTHELNNYTMQEAINFYPKLKAAFKALVPVGVGMNISQPYLETNYTLPSFSQYTAGTTTSNATASGASTATGSAASGSATAKGGASQANGASATPLAATLTTALALLGLAVVLA
ncbi:hypothetical protein HWV62_45063 [Athelia sp. TMB]|nr:hypothetical protein HWV62_45063 [Athelia sp. TMB]